MAQRALVRLTSAVALVAAGSSIPVSASSAAATTPRINRMSFAAYGTQQVKQQRPELEIFGSGFTGATTVRFGGASTPALAVAETHLWVDLPVHSAGTVHVVIDTDHGSSAKNAASTFVYKAPPKIKTVSPDHAKETGGATIILDGSHLSPVSSVDFVDSVGELKAKVLHAGTHKLAVRMPKLATGGAGSIRVTTKWGSGSTPFKIDWNPPRKLASISPDHADVSGRNHVTLRGNMGDVVGVFFGGKKASLVSGNTYGTMVVSAPKHAAGAVNVRVVNTHGTVRHARGVGAFTYRHDGKPKITTTRLPSATVGVGYLAVPHTADDRSGTWSGHLPDGLKFNAGATEGNPTIDGTITSATGAVKVPVTFTDRSGEHSTRALTITTLPQRWREDPDSFGAPACAGTTCYRFGGSSDTQLEIYTESNGGAWTLAQNVPAPAEIGYFDGYAINDFVCGSATTCAAIGIDDTNDNNPSASPDAPFAVTLHDGTWTATQLPTADDVEAVGCTDQTCYAVGPGGPAARPSTDPPDLLTFSDGTWTLTHPSLASSGLTGLDLEAVGCTTDGICRAAGDGYVGKQSTLAVLKIASDGSTTVATLPRLAGASGALRVNRIGCMSDGDCIALARYGFVDRPGTVYEAGTPYYLRLHAAKWTAHTLTTPPGARKNSVKISSFACNLTSQCFVVGSARHKGTHEAYATRFTSASATTFVPKFPDKTKDVGTLQVAACATGGDCYAGGSYNYALFPNLREQQILAFAHLGSGASTTSMQRVTQYDGTDWGLLACADNGLCVGDDRTELPLG